MQVLVDPLRGRLYPYLGGAPASPHDLSVQCSVGATAQVGAGAYDRRVVHAEALGDDPYEGDSTVRGQAAASQAGPCTVALRQALADAEPKLSLLGGTYVIVLPDNGRYDGDVSVQVPAATRLVIVAATWNDGQVGHYDATGRQAYIAGGLTVTGGRGSSLLLDGLVVEGDVAVGPGTLGSLTLSQCTLAGDIIVADDKGANPGIAVRLVRTACLPLRPPPPDGTAAQASEAAAVRFGGVAGSLTLLDSSIDTPGAQAAIHGAELAVTADGSTVRGALTARTLDASNCILDGPVAVRHRQVYGLRYSTRPPPPGHCAASGASRRPTQPPRRPGRPTPPPIQGRRITWRWAQDAPPRSPTAARAAPRWGYTTTSAARCGGRRPSGCSPTSCRWAWNTGYSPPCHGEELRTVFGDFSRRTFDGADGYRAVLLQQGRVVLDADVNEQAEITAHHDEVRARDLVGRHGGPAPDPHAAGRPGPGPFAIVGPSGQETAAWGDLRLTPGTYYVDGVLVECPECPDDAPGGR